jgi:predicted lipid carrier protein YhbT
VATVDDCRNALQKLARQMDEHVADSATTIDLDRTLACTVRDLGVHFHARIAGGRLLDLADGDNPKAKIRLTADSDDLVALVDGELHLAQAVASRRISISANPFDLLKLRKLM